MAAGGTTGCDGGSSLDCGGGCRRRRRAGRENDARRAERCPGVLRPSGNKDKSVDSPRARVRGTNVCPRAQGYAESFIKDEHVGALARELLKNLERKFK